MNIFGDKSKLVQKGELRNVEVELVSLLFGEMTPANQKGFVVKNASGRSFEHKVNSTKFKSETSGTQGRLYVTLMEPDIQNSQGDFYSRDEIQKACDHFAKHGLVMKVFGTLGGAIEYVFHNRKWLFSIGKAINGVF